METQKAQKGNKSHKSGLWIMATLVLFFLGDRGAGFLLKQQVDQSQFRYSRLYTEGAEADILFVGNSRGLMFYQPYVEEITSKSTANLSYNGMPMDLAEVLVYDYYDHHAAPKTLVLDVTLCDRSNLQLIRDFRTYAPYSERLQNLIKREATNNYWGMQLSHLYRYNSEIFQRALYYRSRTDEDWLLDRVINEKMVSGIEETEDYTITLAHLEALKRTVDFARERGTEIKLVVNPYYPPFARKIQNLQEFKDAVAEKTGLPVSDYSLAVADTEGFGDYQHLNKAGSRKYIDQLLADGVIR